MINKYIIRVQKDAKFNFNTTNSLVCVQRFLLAVVPRKLKYQFR